VVLQWYKELERVNLLSEVYPQTTRRIRRAPDLVYRRVFLFFCLYTLLAFYVSARAALHGLSRPTSDPFTLLPLALSLCCR